MSYAEVVVRNVKAELVRNGFTNQDLARTLEISQASISKRMTGRVEFRSSELEKIAMLLNVPIEVLVAPAPAFEKVVAS